MSISQQYAEEVGQALASNCPHVSDSAEAVEAIRSRIVKYDNETDVPPSVSLVLTWAQADETMLAESADAQRQSDAARVERRRLENLSAEETRKLAEEEHRAAHPKFERMPLTLNTNYTDAEMARMSADEYAIKVLGKPAPSMNLSHLAANEKDPYRECFKKTVMQNRNPNKDSRLAMELRRRILTGEIK